MKIHCGGICGRSLKIVGGNLIVGVVKFWIKYLVKFFGLLLRDKMASRPRRNVKSSAQRNKASSSRQREPTPTPSPPSSPENMEFDSTKFLCHEAAEIYKKIHVKSVVRERGFECTPPVHQVNNLYEDIRAEIKRRDWETLCCGDFVGPANCSLMFEFYANVSFPDEQENVYLRGKWIPFGLAYINNMFGTMHLHESSDSYHKMINTKRLDYV